MHIYIYTYVCALAPWQFVPWRKDKGGPSKGGFLNKRWFSWIIDIYIHIPLISLHKYRSVYDNNRWFRKPPLLGPPSSCANPWQFVPARGMCARRRAEIDACGLCDTANLRTISLDVRGFDSSGILILRGGIIMSTGNFPESLSQAILAGRFLVGRLGVV